MTLQFDHTGIETTDIDADVSFYTEVVGMRLLRWGVNLSTGRRIAMLHDGRDAKIELMETPAVTGELAHVAFRTDDVVAESERARAAGYSVVVEPLRIAAALADSAVVLSPAGGRVQLIRYDEGSPDLP